MRKKKWANMTPQERAAAYRQDRKDVFGSIGKELLLVGLHGVKELSGADLHTNRHASKRPWEKKWGER